MRKELIPVRIRRTSPTRAVSTAGVRYVSLVSGLPSSTFPVLLGEPAELDPARLIWVGVLDQIFPAAPAGLSRSSPRLILDSERSSSLRHFEHIAKVHTGSDKRPE